MKLRRWAIQAVLFVTVFTISSIAFGQTTTGNLLGTVTDQTNAAIPGAKVTITEVKTNISKTGTTNASGNYDFETIQPGTYSVAAEQANFKKGVTNNVTVVVNTTVRVDLALEPGAVTETVTVNEAPPALKTDRADVGVDIGSVQTENLPLGTNRNFAGVLALVPGATKPHFVHSNFFNAAASLSSEVNGQSRLANNVMIEGVDDNERSGLLTVLVPPNEAIQSVSVATSNYPAEFGRVGGAVTNVSIKSGTNQFHGGLYEYNRTSATYAKNYFHPEHMAGSTYNYYGGNAGGPIIHDKLFIFGDYLRINDHQGQNQTATVPTALDRIGDFSHGSSNIYDPTTGLADGENRTQFTNNIIPAARISPIAQNILNLIPLPNVPGVASGNYTGATRSTRDVSSFDVKADDTLHGNDHLAYRYSWQKVDQFQSSIFGLAGGPTNGGNSTQKAYNTALNYTHLFSPTFLTELRVGLNHYRNVAKPLDYGSTATATLGIPGVNIDAFTSGLTTIDLDQYAGTLIGTTASYPWDRGETNMDIVSNWTKITGNNTIKFGVDVRRVRDDLMQGQVYGPRGVIQFRVGQTALVNCVAPVPPATAPVCTGTPTSRANSMASLLLDAPNQLGRDVGVQDATWRETQVFGYGQDTWQATGKLTVTAGLRWELYVPPTPKSAGRYSNYDPNTNSLVVAGIGGNPMNLGMDLRKANFAPRLGFAYRANDKTVLRAGYGISYIPWPDNLNNYAVNYPLKQNNVYAPAGSFTQPLWADGVSKATMAMGFAAPVIIPTPSTGIITNAPIASSYNIVNKHWKEPYIHSWNAAVQRSLGRGFVLDVAYIGNIGIDQPQAYNLNSGFTAGLGANGQPFYTKVINGVQLKKTAGVNYYWKQDTTNYNALQVKLDHTFSNGFSTTSSYTFQKGIGYATSSGSGVGGTSIYVDFQRNRAVQTNNRKHQFVQSYVYDLPIGKGKRWVNSGPASWIIGGWQMSGVMSFEAGNPFAMTANASNLNAPNNTQLANFNGNFHVTKHVGKQATWFDTSSFAAPTGAVLGNSGFNGFVGPGFFTWDASVSRRFPITERVNFELRGEGFSVTNTPQFNNPNSNVSDKANFGYINSTSGANNSRQLELSGKITF